MHTGQHARTSGTSDTSEIAKRNRILRGLCPGRAGGRGRRLLLITAMMLVGAASPALANCAAWSGPDPTLDRLMNLVCYGVLAAIPLSITAALMVVAYLLGDDDAPADDLAPATTP